MSENILSENLGRLKHTTKDDCPDCRQAKLQLRVRNFEERVDEEYLYCPKCEYEGKPKKSKAEGIWKKKIKEGELYAESIVQPVRNRERTGEFGNKNNRGYDKRSSR